jgi:hypothetical protein
MGKLINDVYGISRLKNKNSEQAIIQSMAANFNLAPRIAAAYYSEIKQYFDDHTTDKAKGGNILYEALSLDEPAGKPVSECERKLIKLLFQTADDFKTLKEKGLPELRRQKIQRFSAEAISQGTVLTYEDLAHLLTTSVSTIKSDARRLRDSGVLLPTRGRQKDIGRTISHKIQIIDLWLKKYSFTEIEKRSHHSAGSIERYLDEFRKTVYLKEQGMDISEIRLITKRSEKLIKDYLDIYSSALRSPEKYLNLKDFQKWLKKGAQNSIAAHGKGVRK